ncbi:MAG TPA: serine/threonine-protein kinase, partial [Solirubrobacteraceae bacterium]|nr:serine/threonine-protein kinase [Solirubrobacteraceae bacterium]
MGTVYRARQVKLGRTVALKVIAWELSGDPAFRARFEREMEIAAAIDHPHAVPIHWAGEFDGVLFIVMRFVEGTTLLAELQAHGRFDATRAVEIVEQLGGALDAAHARGLIHRDVKPANVMIHRVSGHAFLTDFGVAGAGAGGPPARGDPVMGTVRYMAPERLHRAGPDGVPGDVFSLGCLLWDLLGGTDRLELAALGTVPVALCEVVARAVARDPERRFASAGALAAAARAALGSVPAPQPQGSVAPEPLGPGAAAPSLSGLVVDLCDRAIQALEPGELRDELGAVRRELLKPLRLTVVGLPGCGKSTLIDALRSIDALGSLEIAESELSPPPVARPAPGAVGGSSAEAIVHVIGAGGRGWSTRDAADLA